MNTPDTRNELNDKTAGRLKRYSPALGFAAVLVVVVLVVLNQPDNTAPAADSNAGGQAVEREIGEPVTPETVPVRLAEEQDQSTAAPENTASQAEQDQQNRDYYFDLATPVDEALGGLIRLTNQGDGDAMFALLIRAEACQFHKTEEYCPPNSTGLDTYGSTPGSYYWLVRRAAENGSLEAMYSLHMLVPPPFRTQEDMRDPVMRARFAEIVADHNQAVREHLVYAADAGYPGALIVAAELFAFSDIVDPDRETAAFYLLSWAELTGHPIPDKLQIGIIDGLETDAYYRLQERAVKFVESLRERGLPRGISK